jgi:hypothetical protein
MTAPATEARQDGLLPNPTPAAAQSAQGRTQSGG